MYRNHRNTRPPTSATTAPTTIIVVVLVLERLDEVPVCDGSGATEFVVVSEMGAAVEWDGNAVVGVAGAGAGL